MGHGDAQAPMGGAPYPPQGGYPPQPGGVTAPGGYPVYSPAAGPSAGAAGAYPPAHQQQGPQHFPEPQKPEYHQAPPPAAGHHTTVPPPAGYPGAYPPPPQGYMQGTAAPGGPAPGYPVGGTMGIDQGAAGGVPQDEKCGCSIGWVLFGIGFLFWPFWVAAAFVPLCTKSRNDRMAGLASTIGMLFLVVIAIIIGATSPRWKTTAM